MKVNQILNEDTTLTGKVTLSKLKSKKLQTGLVNVSGDVDLSNRGLLSLPVKFGIITGSFNCSDNLLSLLENIPRTVGKDFNCSNNKLTTLNGGPTFVQADFYCNKNKLISLEGCAVHINGSFSCSNNKLTTLKGGPERVHHNFYCWRNELTSLEGHPSIVRYNSWCSDNNIETLVGVNKFIKKIGGFLHLGNNPIKTGGLGLLLIHELSSCMYNSDNQFGLASRIINKYLSHGSSNIKGIKALYLCEDELIQAGLEAFAQI